MSAKLLIEALVVGILLVILSAIIMESVELVSPDGGRLQKYGLLFVIGAIFHLLCEGAGVNKWYCANGNACSSK